MSVGGNELRDAMSSDVLRVQGAVSSEGVRSEVL